MLPNRSGHRSERELSPQASTPWIQHLPLVLILKADIYEMKQKEGKPSKIRNPPYANTYRFRNSSYTCMEEKQVVSRKNKKQPELEIVNH